MGSLSIGHWIVLALVVLLVFGPGRLAQVGKGLGEGIRGFKKGISDATDDEPPPPPKQIGERRTDDDEPPPPARRDRNDPPSRENRQG